jgi:hypothetical protein
LYFYSLNWLWCRKLLGAGPMEVVSAKLCYWHTVLKRFDSIRRRTGWEEDGFIRLWICYKFSQIRIIISNCLNVRGDFEGILSLLSQSFDKYIVLNDTVIWQSRVRVFNATFNNISVISSLPLAICGSQLKFLRWLIFKDHLSVYM